MYSAASSLSFVDDENEYGEWFDTLVTEYLDVSDFEDSSDDLTSQASSSLLQDTSHDWNDEFQRVMARVSVAQGPIEKEEAFVEVKRLANDFVHCAKLYGEVIISEVNVPVVEKSIRPIQTTGVAGGEKFLVQNIIFKFAVDDSGMYMGDENAMKAAGHELKSLVSVHGAGVEGIHVPLMALVDYKGYRLVAVSVLPLEEGSLIYGTDEAGKEDHVEHADDEEFNAMMGELGNRLNLARHTSSGVEVVGPADIEGHRGTDGRFYLLDFARLMPPQAREKHSPDSWLWHQMLRPEFVRSFDTPLSSDAFSRFQDDRTPDADVMLATKSLLHEVVPRFSQWLDQEADKGVMLGGQELTRALHKNGINMRQLGRVRACVKNESARQLLLEEMVARVAKNWVRSELREAMQESQTPKEEPLRAVVVRMLNNMLKARGTTQNELKRRLVVKFGRHALAENEVAAEWPLWSHVRVGEVIARLQQMRAIHLDWSSLTQLRRAPDSFVVVDADIGALRSRVKHMSNVDVAMGMVLAGEAERGKGGQADRVCELAKERFAASGEVSHEVEMAWARVLMRQGELRDSVAEFEDALAKLQRIGAAANEQAACHAGMMGVFERRGDMVGAEEQRSIAQRLFSAVGDDEALSKLAHGWAGPLWPTRVRHTQLEEGMQGLRISSRIFDTLGEAVMTGAGLPARMVERAGRHTAKQIANTLRCTVLVYHEDAQGVLTQEKHLPADDASEALPGFALAALESATGGWHYLIMDTEEEAQRLLAYIKAFYGVSAAPMVNLSVMRGCGYVCVLRALLARLTGDGKEELEEDGILLSQCKRGHLEVVRFLVHDVGLALPDQAIHAAARSGNCDLIEFVIEHGRDVDVDACEDSTGRRNTPLHLAVCAGHIDAVQLLVSLGATFSHDLLVAAAEHDRAHVLRWLMEQFDVPVDWQDMTDNESTLMHHAAMHGGAHVVEMLIEMGANVNATTSHGRTALTIAAWKSHPRIIRAVVDANGDLDIQNTWGRTAIHIAAQWGDYDTVKALLDGHPRLDLVNAEGQNALHIAVSKGAMDIVRLLLNSGADPHKRVLGTNASVLDIAREHGHARLEDLFLDLAENTTNTNPQ